MILVNTVLEHLNMISSMVSVSIMTPVRWDRPLMRLRQLLQAHGVGTRSRIQVILQLLPGIRAMEGKGNLPLHLVSAGADIDSELAMPHL